MVNINKDKIHKAIDTGVPKGTRKMYGRLDYFLFLYGLLYVVIGYSYTGDRPTFRTAASLDVIVDPVPLGVYGFIWAGIGLISILTGLLPYQRTRPLGFAALGMMPFAWGTVFFVSWLAGDTDRGWVLTAFFFGIGTSVFIVSGMVPVKSVAKVVEIEK